MLPSVERNEFPQLQVAIDLNAVPPHGLGTIKPTDSDQDRAGVHAWGSIGVGALKMKIHKAVLRALFDGEPVVFDLDEIHTLAGQIIKSSAERLRQGTGP